MAFTRGPSLSNNPKILNNYLIFTECDPTTYYSKEFFSLSQIYHHVLLVEPKHKRKEEGNFTKNEVLLFNNEQKGVFFAAFGAEGAMRFDGAQGVEVAEEDEIVRTPWK